MVYIMFGFERYTLYLLAHAGAKTYESKELLIIVIAFVKIDFCKESF